MDKKIVIPGDLLSENQKKKPDTGRMSRTTRSILRFAVLRTVKRIKLE